jgi:hypothetical protein
LSDVLEDSYSLEARSFEGHLEHSSTQSIFSLLGHLGAAGNDDLLVLSSLNHL